VQEDRIFNRIESEKKIEAGNMKLLVQLLEIKEGKRLSVSKADDWSKFPSISVINQHKKEVLTKIVD
jgi:hypothetical protein